LGIECPAGSHENISVAEIGKRHHLQEAGDTKVLSVAWGSIMVRFIIPDKADF
jgi:ribonuclease HIII